MPARDIYHDAVKQAPIKDSWVITDDPLHLKWGRKDLYVDLAASQLIAAQKQERRIAVEVKAFSGRSEVDDLEKALGQYVLYFDVLAELEPHCLLYLALPIWAYGSLFEEPLGQLLLKNERLRLIVFEPEQESIKQWLPSI